MLPITKMYSNTNFIFESTVDSVMKYILTNGSYLIKDVPLYHAMYLFNDDKEDLISLSSSSTITNNHNLPGLSESNKSANGVPDGSTLYYGDVTITVKGDFDKVSIFSDKGGLMNGEDLFIYNSKHCN